MASPQYKYQTGFGNEFASEAIPGTLPEGQNSPQICPKGLYAEQLSGTAFTVPRAGNRRSWLYRIVPPAHHTPFVKQDNGALYRGSFAALEPNPERMRWAPIKTETLEGKSVDFSQGFFTYCGAGAVSLKTGIAVHLYLCNANMTNKAMYNSDGEMLIVPQLGTLDIRTEFGYLEVKPGEIVVIPRGVYFSVSVSGPTRGYICESYEGHFQLPNLGPIGANGLANPRDFMYPVACFEDHTTEYTIVNKYQSQLYNFQLKHSPFNVVAWHGNLAPYKYDLSKFCVVNTVLFDHADPSIFCVLTVPTNTPGTAACDFVIFPPRWCTQEHTFRPPYFHRNCMSEFMGLIKGAYDAKPEGFQPGGATLHSTMTAHGPDSTAFDRATAATLAPEKLDNTLAFMFESCYMLSMTEEAVKQADKDYWKCWSTLESKFQK